jgi:hypothetical protein
MGDTDLGQEDAVTYAGAYGRNERVPVDRVLRREGHPLGVRRAEATKVATAEEQEASTNHKRWTLGAAAGALLVAGTFAAGALGLSGGATPTAGSAPEHAPASPGHTPADSGPVIGAPTSTQDDQQQSTEDQQQQPQETTPSSVNPRADVPVQANPNTGGTSSGGGDSQRTTTPGSSTTTPPATTEPAPETTTPTTPEEDEGSGLGDVVGDVLDPVTDVVGGVLTPSSASTTSSSSTPAGPALTLIDPLGDLLAS